MKKEDLKHFIDNLDVEEFKQYFYYHDRKETREHFGLSAGNLNDVLHHFNIKMPKELRNERRVQTYNDKYGCDNVFQSDYFKEKNAQTRLDRYGDPNYSNHEQAIKTIHDTIGMDELNRRRSAGHQRRSAEDVAKSNQKRKETCINKYGVDHIPQTDDSIRKMGASQSNRLNALSDEEKSIILFKLL